MILNFNKLESLLIESCQAGTFITNLQGKLIECNSSFVKMFGYTNKQEILSVNAVSFYASANERENYLNILHKEGKVRGYKATATRNDGCKIVHSINSDFFKAEDGKTYILGSTIDVTEIENFGNQLNESNKKYQDLVENSLEIIQSFDSEGKLLFCNRIWHEKLEYSPEEIKSLNLFDIISHKDHLHCKELFGEVLQGKALKNVEVTFVSKSGKNYLLEGNIVPLQYNGRLIATHAFFRDVTEKKLAVQKIIDQEKLLQTIFNTVPICLYLKSSDGKYIHANEMMEKTLGFSVIDKQDSEIFPLTTCQLLKTTDTDALNNPNEIVRFELEGEFSGRTRAFYAGKKAIQNKATNALDIFGFSLEISEQKNSLKKIEDNEKILQFILNNSDSGFLLFNYSEQEKCFILEFANKFANELLKLEEKGIRFSDVFKFLKDKIDFSNFLTSNNYQEIFDWEKIEDKNIPSKNFTIKFSIMNETDSSKRLIVFIIDITEQQKLINDLEIQLNENLILIGEIHHRVKNNLAVIDGLLELKKAQTKDKNLSTTITDIQMRIKSIALVHQKLYQSNIFNSINLKDYVPELSNFYKKLFHKDSLKEVEFNIQSKTDSFISISKAVTFGLILSELISNSCKYGLGKDKLTIDIEVELERIEDRNKLVVMYADHGEGLPEGIKQLKQGGFGLRLIDNLLKQLKGKYEIKHNQGFTIQFEFLLD